MGVDCPDCGNTLRRRAPNFLENVRRREIEDVHDRFVCLECRTTFAEDEVVDRPEQSIQMRDWMTNE